jgi:hypothetical protein
MEAHVHTAKQLFREGFEVEIAGNPATLEDFLPDWTARDRFGIVVTEPFGALGASLLIQLATANFFDAKPERRQRETADYPEIYVFHFRGVYGDHSNYDFWPPRKEVLLGQAEPLDLLEAINDRAITRLALPDGPLGDRMRLRVGHSTWAEERSAIGRIASCVTYTTSGETPGADVVLRSSHPRVEENVVSTLDALGAVRSVLELPADEFAEALPGPSVADDVYRWQHTVEARIGEVDQTRKDQLGASRAAMLAKHKGVSTESYRRLSIDAALRRIAALG